MNFLLLSLISLIWGSSFILIKRATLCFGPMNIAAYRVVSGAVILWVIWKLGRQKRFIKKSDILPIVFLACMAYIVPFLVQPYLIARYESGFVSLIICLIPLITILISIPM